MTASSLAPRELSERRRVERLPALLPASIEVNQQNFTARVLDIARGGVMLEAAAAILPGTRLRLRCGHIEAEALVIWAHCGLFGIEFTKPLHDRALEHHIARAIALENRRNRHVPTLA